MKFQPGHIPSTKGKVTATDPIKTLDAVGKVKELLKGHTRNYALFVVAVNSALRGGDLTRIQWEDTQDDGVNITMQVLEGKTRKPRIIPLNPEASAALRAWRRECNSEYIYSGQRGPLTVAQWGRMVKTFCKDAGFEGHFASHTTRKTFVRVHHDELGTSMATLMEILNHASERQTLTYMGKMDDDVAKAYGRAI